MSIHRILLTTSFDYIKKRKAFTAPTKREDRKDHGGYSRVEQIKPGDTLILVTRDRKDMRLYIRGIGITYQGCIISDLTAYEEEIHFSESGFRYVAFEPLVFLSTPILGVEYFNGTISGNPFNSISRNFCCRVNIEENQHEAFNQKMNQLLNFK